MAKNESNPFNEFAEQQRRKRQESLFETQHEVTEGYRETLEAQQSDINAHQYRRRLIRYQNETNATFEKLLKATEDVKEENRTIKEENSHAQAKQLEITGIIVALFTFISLQVQIFVNISKVFYVPLSLLTLGGILFFVSLLSLVNATRLYANRRWYVVVTALFAVFSLVFIYLSWVEYGRALDNQETCRTVQTQIIERGLTDEDVRGILDGKKSSVEKITDIKRALEYSGCAFK